MYILRMLLSKVTFLLFASVVAAAPTLASSPNIIQESFDRRTQVNRVGMTLLGAWAIGNILVGTSLALAEVGDPGFHQMNALWNTVNLGLAAFSLIQARRSQPPSTLSKEIQAQHTIEKILLFNAGLDVGYMATGLWLSELNTGQWAEELPGWGNALILQGAFLFAFDLVLFAVHRRNRIYEGAFAD
jgi:hypothetical protein